MTVWALRTGQSQTYNKRLTSAKFSPVCRLKGPSSQTKTTVGARNLKRQVDNGVALYRGSQMLLRGDGATHVDEEDLKQTSGARCQVCAQATLNRKVVIIRGQGERYHLHHVCAITCFSCRVLPRRARSITRCSRPSNDNMYSSEFQYIQTILIGD